MLRWLVLLILALNATYYAWTHDWLAPLGLAPQRAGEPERLQQQIRPELMRIQPDTAANQPPPLPPEPAPTSDETAIPPSHDASQPEATQQ